MVYTEFAKVKNVLTVKTKFGMRKVCNVITEKNGEEAIWAEDLSSFSNLSPNQQIQVIRGTKGKLTVLENQPPRHRNGKSELTHISEPLNNVVDDLLDELPILSEKDKKKLSVYIQQNSKLLKYCCDCVAKEFPDIDDKSVRSLGITIFINAQQALHSQTK
ncbi:hypothetical protein [Myxosarcina sp. GI1(2024)]